MGSVFSFNTKRVFTLEDAKQLLPVLYRITENSNSLVKEKMNHLKALRQVNAMRANEIQKEIETIIECWNQKIEKLGARSQGVWVADFDSGDGYYCWKFPETDIAHFHKYDEGFTGRQPIL